MSKQDKIEKSQKQKAVLITKDSATVAAVLNKTGTDTTVSAIVGERFWQIAGTQIYSRKKEELNDVRRAKNLEAGTPEFTYTGEGESKTRIATDSNTWRFRVTKGPDHPVA
jgi:hypothetical protein